MVYIDYVGGSLAGKIFKMMPRGSELVVLGDLAHEQLQLDARNIWTFEKIVSGF